VKKARKYVRSFVKEVIELLVVIYRNVLEDTQNGTSWTM
jgi:hypothetical protein